MASPAPLAGVPVRTVSGSRGTTGCANSVVSSNTYFSSQDYLNTLHSTAGFYSDLLPAINGTFNSSTASFKNGYASESHPRR